MTTPNTFLVGACPMLSASGEAAKFKYFRHDDSKGNVWLVADHEDAADNIYVELASTRGSSNGFAGRTLDFEMVYGSTLSLQGPWRTSAEALLAATGVDLTSTYRTFCVIAKSRSYPAEHRGRALFSDVLYIDEAPVRGPFDRPEILEKAEKFADELGHSVYFYKESKGGSSSRTVDPLCSETGKRKYVPALAAGESA